MSISPRPRRARLLLGAVAAVSVLLGATACQPRPVAKDKVVIFVHGWSALGNGNNCANNFGSLESSLRADGFTGAFVTVGYYDSDSNCDVNLRSWNSSISNSTSWEDLSKTFSQYVYTTYTSKGITVDLVGHSMGGLIIRGAVKGSAHGESGFSAPLKVEDAVTLAAPHDGAAWYSYGCLWGQCAGLKPGSDEIEWVQQDGNPQGTGGTEWTVLGSTDDDTVPSDSAMHMDLPDARKVVYSDIEHGDYMSNATAQARTAQALSSPNL